MDPKERLRLQKIYEEEISDEELTEMALANCEEYNEGVYELVMAAVNKRGLSEAINEIKQGTRQSLKEEKWVEIYKFDSEQEKATLEQFFRDQNIPINIISSDCSTHGGIFRSAVGIGILCVKKQDVDIAKNLIEKFKITDQANNLPLSDDAITQAILKVLDKHNISNKENIVKEIIKEINEQ